MEIFLLMTVKTTLSSQFWSYHCMGHC